ncbi:MAG: ABC transporter ATP-binding protein [Clostridiales bacterium]|nr:ABC transporter ATP-binding protein [Clostridiales bacterium]
MVMIMLIIDSLKVKYKDTVALDVKRPIRIEPGSRVGVIGSNGAGKTTLVKALIGLTDYEGSFSLGVPREDIAVHLQHNMYQDSVSVKTLMELILNSKLENHILASRLVEEFSFEHCLHKKFSKLSGGEQQKMTMILVLAREAKLLFFDEVTTGLDFQNRENLMELLKNWKWRKDQTVIMISHYYKELETVTDKLLILDKGRVIDYGDTDELFHKYCGDYLFIVDNVSKAAGISNDGYEGKSAEEGQIIFENIRGTMRESIGADMYHEGDVSLINNNLMIRSRNKEESRKIAEILIDKGLNYRFTVRDIEVLYTVAKERYYEQI